MHGSTPNARSGSGRRYAATLALVVAAALLCPSARLPAWGEEAAAKKADNATCDRAAFRVVVDVGHTAKVPGAVSARGVPEFEFNLRLAKLIERQLIDAGFAKTMLLVTEGPTLMGLARRVARANQAHADLFLSIHHDSVPDWFLENWEYEGKPRHFCDRFKGHSIFVSNDNRDRKGSLLFARLLGMALKARGLQYTPHYTESFMRHRRRQLLDAEAGVYRYDLLAVLRETRMPAALLEAGSIINREEELLLSTPEHQALIAAAAVEAVTSFCQARRARGSDAIARHPAASPAKQTARPAAATFPANLFKRQ
jgi:N-acetylmuramoyl-L-alanine amidase